MIFFFCYFSYEPELHPGATYRMKDLKAVLKIFQTGSITITAPSILNVQTAVERVYPLVYEFKKPKPPQSVSKLNNYKNDTKKQSKKKQSKKRKRDSSDEGSSEGEENDLFEQYENQNENGIGNDYIHDI